MRPNTTPGLSNRFRHRNKHSNSKQLKIIRLYASSSVAIFLVVLYFLYSNITPADIAVFSIPLLFPAFFSYIKAENVFKEKKTKTDYYSVVLPLLAGLLIASATKSNSNFSAKNLKSEKDSLSNENKKLQNYLKSEFSKMNDLGSETRDSVRKISAKINPQVTATKDLMKEIETRSSLYNSILESNDSISKEKKISEIIAMFEYFNQAPIDAKTVYNLKPKPNDWHIYTSRYLMSVKNIVTTQLQNPFLKENPTLMVPFNQFLNCWARIQRDLDENYKEATELDINSYIDGTMKKIEECLTQIGNAIEVYSKIQPDVPLETPVLRRKLRKKVPYSPDYNPELVF